jgi:hypothetical protein
MQSRNQYNCVAAKDKVSGKAEAKGKQARNHPEILQGQVTHRAGRSHAPANPELNIQAAQ